MRELILQAQSLTQSYRGQQVLGPCSIELYRGEIVAVIGPSGAGKTTLLRLLAGIGQPTSGQVLQYGQPVSSGNGGVAMVFQNYALFPWRTALRNVEYPLQIARVSKGERAARAKSALDLVGLSGAAHLYPHQLSGGMQQRVAIARAVVMRPSVMLLDEPLSALDPVTRQNLQSHFIDLFEKVSCAVLLVTHDLEEAVRLADRVLIISGSPGTIVAQYEITPNDPERHISALKSLFTAHHQD